MESIANKKKNFDVNMTQWLRIWDMGSVLVSQG
jgi:hypothetical protein